MNDNGEFHAATPTRGGVADLILHPIRLRIVTSFSAESLTAGELSERLPDVPQATLYRHLNTLRRAGILAVSEERRVRGATERRYVLHPGAANLQPDDLATGTSDDHLRWFAGFVAGLLGEFGRYVRRGRPDLVRDGVGYRQVILNVSDEEFAAMAVALNGALLPYVAKQPGVGRRRRLLATISLPVDSGEGNDA